MKEIAAILDLSARTVETHKYEMMRVLGVQSTAELVALAVKRGLGLNRRASVVLRTSSSVTFPLRIVSTPLPHPPPFA